MPEELHQFGRLEIPTLDEVAPRIRNFTADLIEHLREAGVVVETTEIFLLNSSNHKIVVPLSIDTIPVECSFDASLPRWSNSPVVRFYVSFDYGQRYFWSESKQNKVLPFNHILRRFFEQRQIILDTRKKEKEEQEKRLKAENSVQEVLHAVQPKGATEVHPLPETPTLVQVKVNVTPEQAIEFITKTQRSKNSTWKQNTPSDQAVVLIGAVKGWVSNLEEGTSDLEKVTSRIEDLLGQLMNLTQSHMLPEWINETEKP